MKGLLIKDLKLMKGQKNFFFMIMAIYVAVAAISDDWSYILGCLPLVLSLFALNTISQDKFDNGNAFLFTLPVSRTAYTASKYCLSLLFGGGGLLLAAFLAVFFGILKGTASVSEIAAMALMQLPVLILMPAIAIPCQLKFDDEKDRIALLFCGLALILAIKGIDLLKMNKAAVLNLLPMANQWSMIIFLIILAFMISLASMKISNVIMKNKEF